VHRARLDALRALGLGEEQLARLHAPVGSIPNAKSKATFAFGVLAEMLADAKAQNLIA
jgi:xanthine dehydrogenase accessory factor